MKLKYLWIVILGLFLGADYPTEVEWEKMPENFKKYTPAEEPTDDRYIEKTLADGTRCDYVNEEYAIEIDWAKAGKNYEAVGQALKYADDLKLKPGIILLVKKPSDLKYVNRITGVCAKYNIRLWVEWVQPIAQ